MAKRTEHFSRALNQRVSRVTSKLDKYRTPLGLAVIAIGAFLAYVAFVSTTGPPFQGKYQIKVSVPPDAPTLRTGQAVRIGGKLAGLISDVEPDRESGGSTVTANVTKTEFRPLPDDTTAYVRVHSIVYNTYLELRPGESDAELENQDQLAKEATSGVDLLEVVQLFDDETRESLQDTVVNLGFGVAGRGAEANQALVGIDQMTRDLRAQLRAATSSKGALAKGIRGGARTASGLRGDRSDDVAAFIGSADATTATVAGRESELRSTIQLLPPFQDQLLATGPQARPLLNDVGPLAQDLLPAVREVNAQLPNVNRLLALGDTLRVETDRIADVADPVLETARPVVYGLFPTITSLKPLNRDLANLKATVEPYKPEIAQAGTQLADTTSFLSPGGIASGAPAGRVVAIFTCHSNYNPIPEPGEAREDAAPC